LFSSSPSFFGGFCILNHLIGLDRIAGQEKDVTGVPDENLSQKKKKKKGKANETDVAPDTSVAMDKDSNPTATSESEKAGKLNTDG